MVINFGALKDRNLDLVARDILAVVKPVHAAGAILKVIIETALLTDEEKKIACLLAKEAGADFVKTSTGFGPGGATEAAVRVMREVVGPEVGVKASGGIRDRATVLRMLAAGASRIGTSSTAKILAGAEEED